MIRMAWDSCPRIVSGSVLYMHKACPWLSSIRWPKPAARFGDLVVTLTPNHMFITIKLNPWPEERKHCYSNDRSLHNEGMPEARRSVTRKH